MAAGSAAAKENAAPCTWDATASAAAMSRRHGHGVAYAVKSCGVKKKRPPRARLLGRVPLRDITNLIGASSAVAGPEASPAVATELAKPDAVLPLPAVMRVTALKDGDAAAPATKAAGYSLRKGFR